MAAFRVIDTGQLRTDLASRQETKFALRRTDVSKIRTILAGNLRRQVHAGPISVVRSLYFDDPTLTCCRANLAGLTSRRKLRIRWYDSLLPDTSFYVEVKWRENTVTGKRRWQIETDQPLSEFSYRDISRQIARCVDAGDRALAWLLTEPVLLVEYQREHFVSSDGVIRCTLDHGLRYYDQSGRSHITAGFATDAHDLIVVEGKSPAPRAAGLPQLLHPFASRVTSSSKYVLGCQLLGLTR